MNTKQSALGFVLSIAVSCAQAITLGNITMVSKAGEPLQAQLEVRDISALENNALQVLLAAPDLYKTAKVDYAPEVDSLKVQLQRRFDGSAYVEFSSDKPIAAASLDLLIEFRWASGRRVFVGNLPTALATSPAPAASAPVVSGNASTAATATAPSADLGVSAQPAAEPAGTAAMPAPSAATEAAPPAPNSLLAAKNGTTALTVAEGDTAGDIALRHKNASVSLDQMLLALLRANPQAFVDDNVNRLKAGAALQLPTTEQAASTPANQATLSIQAQAADFADYKAKLAANAPVSELPKAGRTAQGQITGKANDNKAATGQDKLTLGKAGGDGAKTADLAAAQKQAEQTASDKAAAGQSVDELNKLAQAAKGMDAANAGVDAPATAAAPDTAADNLLDELVASPITPYLAGGLVALLLLWGWKRSREPAPEWTDGPATVSSTAQTDQAPSNPFGFDLDLPVLPDTTAAEPALVVQPSDMAVSNEAMDSEDMTDQEVRMSLAEELWDMGQHNTARALAEEVARDARGELQRQAQDWLNAKQA